MTAIAIRPERGGDAPAIFALTEAAFRDMPHAEGDEQQLVGQLRADGDLALSLVAEDATRIVGHAAFSPVSRTLPSAEDAIPNQFLELSTAVQVTPESGEM